MNNLSAWAPALVALASSLIGLGMMYSKVGDHEKRLDSHEERIGRVEIEAAKSEGFRQGVMSSQK